MSAAMIDSVTEDFLFPVEANEVMESSEKSTCWILQLILSEILIGYQELV